jgi:hypothetical protein
LWFWLPLFSKNAVLANPGGSFSFYRLPPFQTIILTSYEKFFSKKTFFNPSFSIKLKLFLSPSFL